MIIDVCFQWTDLFSTGDAICNMVDNYYNIMWYANTVKLGISKIGYIYYDFYYFLEYIYF